AEGDRVTRAGIAKGLGNRRQPFTCSVSADVRHRAEKLITAVAHDNVIGTQGFPHRRRSEAEELVAGSVTLVVVDLFQLVYIDEGKHERAAGPAGTLDLAPDLHETGPARPDARQLVGRCDRDLPACARQRAPDLLALAGSCLTVGGGARSISRRVCAILFCPQTNLGQSGVKRRLTLAARVAALCSRAIASRGDAIPLLRAR